jgi:hypothetical protein
MRRAVLAAMIALPLCGAVLRAQEEGVGRQGILRPVPRVPKQRAAMGAAQANRQQLQRQIRESFWRAAKQRIGFSDEQMQRLEQTSQRFDQRRRQLAQQEKALRVSLRSQTLADSAANQPAIASSIDGLLQLQRQRVDLQIEEQKEFASFMTPLQRSKFLALQEQVKRRVQELQRNRPDSIAARALPPDAP